MSSQPNETAREDIANGLQILNALLSDVNAVQVQGPPFVVDEMALCDLRAIQQRLESALRKMAASQSKEWEGVTLGGTVSEADRQAYIRANFPPLDYAVPDESETA
jgi:hypothetical protein